MAQELEKYLSWLLTHYDHLKQEGYGLLTLYWPRFDNYSYFDKFVILNLIIIGTYLIFSFFASFSIKRLYERIMKIIFNLPPIRRKIKEDLQKAKQEILKEYPANLKVENQKVSYKIAPINIGDASEKQTLKGKKSGQRYAEESHSKFVANLAKQFAYANPLHTGTFPLVKQMEIEVIAMTAEAIGLKDQNGIPCGTVNSGGTESILMAMFAYRQYKIKEKGAYRPNLVVCETGHAASIKACQYFDIQVRLIPYDSNFQMNLRKMKSAIDQNTICVYTSYPNYPFGTADPIDIIGPYCHKREIPVHVDMCLGGFVAPFLDKDWKLPVGITSVSADPHKYGLSAKGVSVLLFNSEKYRKYQYFVTTFWPGGLYGTPGVAGSRSGVFIASAWISMMKLGRKGFQDNAKLIQETLIKMSEELQKLGFQILSKQKICVLTFRHKKIPINAVHQFMKQKQWGFSFTQRPFAFQFSFTPLNCHRRDDMIKDLKECVEYYSKHQFPTKQSLDLAVYGVCAQVKDDGKKNFILATMMDTFIDLC